MKIFILVLVFTGICLYEVPRMLRKRLYGELWAFSILLLAGFILALLSAMRITIPLPPLPQ